MVILYKRQSCSAGFTLVELVTVILLLGILSAIAIPRLFNLNNYQTRAAYDEVVGAVRYAQKLAVASGCPVRVQLAAGGYSLQQRADCDTGIFADISADHPVSSSNFDSVALSPTAFTFDAMGRSSKEVDIDVGDLSFTVVAATGYVDAP